MNSKAVRRLATSTAAAMALIFGGGGASHADQLLPRINHDGDGRLCHC